MARQGALQLSPLCTGPGRVLTVEGNYSGQLARLLAQECRLRVAGSVRRYDGRPLTTAEVEAGIEGLAAGDDAQA